MYLKIHILFALFAVIATYDKGINRLKFVFILCILFLYIFICVQTHNAYICVCIFVIYRRDIRCFGFISFFNCGQIKGNQIYLSITYPYQHLLLYIYIYISTYLNKSSCPGKRH